MASIIPVRERVVRKCPPHDRTRIARAGPDSCRGHTLQRLIPSNIPPRRDSA